MHAAPWMPSLPSSPRLPPRADLTCCRSVSVGSVESSAPSKTTKKFTARLRFQNSSPRGTLRTRNGKRWKGGNKKKQRKWTQSLTCGSPRLYLIAHRNTQTHSLSQADLPRLPYSNADLECYKCRNSLSFINRGIVLSSR
jgi:hypothetical protein